jgi:acetyl esterase/lipase
MERAMPGDADQSYEFDIEEVEYLRHGGTPYLARVFRPRGKGPFPAVVEAHGGAWIAGNRAVNDPINREVAKGGVVVAALDFRNPPEATYPGSVADINYGVRWLKANAARFGTRPEWVGSMGTSSGGHLVVLAALKPADPRYAAIPLAGGAAFDARVAYVVAMWPVICPPSRYRAKKANPAAMQGRGSPGGAIGNEDRYWLTEAAMEEGSPNFAVQRGDAIATPHILYLQNPEDPLHPRANLESFVAGYRKRGGTVHLEFFEGPKYDVIRSDPASPEARASIAKIVAFIRAETTAPAPGAAAVG